MLPGDSVTLEQFHGAHRTVHFRSGITSAHCTIDHGAIRRFEDRDQRTSGSRQVLAILPCHPENNTVCPAEPNLNSVFTSSTSGIRVCRVELELAVRRKSNKREMSVVMTYLFKHDTSLVRGISTRGVQVAEWELSQQTVDGTSGRVPTAECSLSVSILSNCYTQGRELCLLTGWRTRWRGREATADFLPNR